MISTRPSLTIDLTRALLLTSGLLLFAGCAMVDIGGPTAPADDPEAGQLTLPDGKIVHVYPNELAYSGTASYLWPDGRWYAGIFENGRPHGEGTLELTDGGVYVGQFKNGLREGAGTMESDRGTYSGRWRRDAPHGFGEFTYADGSFYRGNWTSGRRHGKGSYERPNGAHYDGEWSSGVPHGFGIMREPDGLRYEGQWQLGDRTGYGRIENRAGLTYEGIFHENRRTGFGKETRPNGSYYEGEWDGDVRQGHGVEVSPNGDTHDGAWDDNVPLGLGTRRIETGIEITGYWNGDYVNSGTLRLPDGSEFTGDLYAKNNSVISTELLQWLTDAGKHGNAHAQLLLGDAYSKFMVPAPDLVVAKEWYRRAARAEVAEAMYRIGTILVNQNHAPTGIDYLNRASAKGHTMANLLLGSYYQLGEHVEIDHARARQYYEAATQRGNIVARNNLAWLLSTSPNSSVRDGPQAVALIRPIAHLYNSWGYYDTLAAALAEAGEFEEAREIQQLAIHLAEGAPELPGTHVVAQMQARLHLFQTDVAFREIIGTSRNGL